MDRNNVAWTTIIDEWGVVDIDWTDQVFGYDGLCSLFDLLE